MNSNNYIHWCNIPDAERLQLWKSFRKDIADKPLLDQLDQMAHFCRNMPYAKRTLDYYNPEAWPTPWDIVYYASFCKSSISLLIFYTLVLVNKDIDICLHIVDDKSDVYLLPIINEQFVLNYEIGSVNSYLDIQDQITTIKIYDKTSINRYIK